MDVEDAGEPDPGAEELVSRVPEEDDVVRLCARLNELGARYVVIGGFAIISAGYARMTSDVDFIIAIDLENEARVYKALESLPDQAVRELKPGEVGEHTVVRVCDEIMVNLMKAACGIEYAEAAQDVVVRAVQGVPIPFASPRLLWRMKKPTRREKDLPDLVFLAEWFRARGEEPPDC